MNISGGTLELSDDTALSENTHLNMGQNATLSITNTNASRVSLDSSNLAGSGTINKTGSGVLNLSGDNSAYLGTFTQTAGTTVLSSGSKLFGTNAADNIISGGNLFVSLQSSNDMNQNVTLAGGNLTFLSHADTTLDIDNSHLSKVLVSAPGTAITFTSGVEDTYGLYNLKEDINLPSSSTIAFEDSLVTLGAINYIGGTQYSFTNSILDLASSDGVGVTQNFTFSDLLFDTSSLLDVDIRFETSTGTNASIFADMLTSTGAAQKINLGQITFHNTVGDDIQGTEYYVDVLGGNLTFENSRSEYTTGVDRFLVEEDEDGKQIKLTFLGKTNAHSLYDMNNTSQERTFSLSAIDKTEYTYYIDKSLDATLAGEFTVAGKGAAASTISGEIINGAGDLDGTRGSLFKTINDGTSLVIENITITKAFADGSTDTGNGSVVYQNSDSETILSNVVIAANDSVGNGGAIYNEKGDIILYGSADFNGNSSQSGQGGGIYNNDALTLFADAGHAISFSNNTANGTANDIYNTANGVISVSGDGIVNIGSGISGAGTIQQIGGGTLNINADSSAFTGKFTQTAGITNAKGDFFNGENIINGGVLNFFNTAAQTAGSLDVGNSGIVNLTNNSALSGITATLTDGHLNFTGSSKADAVSFDISGGIMSVADETSINNSAISQSDGGIAVAGAMNNTDITQTGGALEFQEGGSFNGGTLNISGGITQFDTGSSLAGGMLYQTDGTLNWNGGSKLATSSLTSDGGTLNILNDATLALNNSSDIIGAITQLNIAENSALSNLSGNVTINVGDIVNGSLSNANIMTFDGLIKDFSQSTGSYHQTADGAQLNIVGGSQIQNGSKAQITAGTVNVGSGVSTDSLWAIGSGAVIGTNVAINVFGGNTIAVNGGQANLDAGDTLNGTTALVLGNLYLSNVTNNGILLAAGGNMHLRSGTLALGTNSSISGAVATDIASNARLDINSGAAVVLDNNDTWSGMVNVTAGTLVLNNLDVEENKLTATGGILRLQNGTNFTIGNNMSIGTGVDVEILNSAFNISDNSLFNSFGTLAMDTGILNTLNGETENYSIGTLRLGTMSTRSTRAATSGAANFEIDISGDPLDYDTFNIADIEGTGTINISRFALLSAPIATSIDMHIFQAPDYSGVTFTESAGIVHSGIFDYSLIPGVDGHYMLMRSGNNAQDLNPQVFRGQTAMLAAYRNQLIVNNMLIEHVHLDSNGGIRDFGPWQFRENPKNGVWIKPYASFGELSLGNGLSGIDNDSYGTIVGIDLPAMEFGNNWKFLPTFFAAYNSGQQKYAGTSIDQEGGQGGFMGSLSSGNLITSLMLYGGAYRADMHAADYEDTINNWFVGSAFKVSYNFKPVKNFIVQPSLLTAFNMYGDQNWTSDFGSVDFKNDRLNGANIAPGLTFIYEQPKWNGYAEVVYTHNIGGKIGGYAGNIALPEAGIGDNYLKYSLGITADLYDTLSLYGATTYEYGNHIKDVIFNFGLTWKF
jgi:hypothetical protein